MADALRRGGGAVTGDDLAERAADGRGGGRGGEPRGGGLRGLLRDEWPRLLLDLAILVAGITASFALEDWRQRRQDEATERRAWATVAENLAADTTQLASRLAQLRTQVDACDRLLAGAVPPDSAGLLLDRAMVYVTFVPTDYGYDELRRTSSARELRARGLLGDLARLHGRAYALATEWDAINRRFLLDRFYPYLEAEAPAPYLDPDAATALRGGRTAAARAGLGLSASHAALAGERRFRNLLVSDRFYKGGQAQVYARALDQARGTLAAVRAALADGGGAGGER